MTTAAAIDLTAARTGLVAWFAELTGLDASAVRWRDEPRPVVAGVAGELQPIAIRELGQGEEQHEHDGGADEGEELVRAVGGSRVLSLSLLLDGYDQRLPEGVLFALERARTKMVGAPSLDALRALGFAFVRSHAVQGLPNREHQGRAYPRAVLDVELGFTAVESLDPTGYFAHAQLETEARDVDDSLLPSPPNGSEWVPELP